MRKLFILSGVLAAGVLASLNAFAAEMDSTVFTGSSVTNRTTITSEQGDFYMKSNVFIYRGDVHVNDPRMKLTCGLLVTESPKLEEGRFDRATATTNVVIDWVDENGTNHATAEQAVYTYAITNASKWETNAFVVLTGDPIVKSARGVFRSDPIVWNRMTDVITTTNFNRTDIYQSPSNTAPGFFENAPPPPAKKIVPSK